MHSIVRVHWSAAHRLPDHPKCCHVHGHNYTAEIGICGFLPSSGMILDFDILKAALERFVSAWDHAFVCLEGDHIGVLLQGADQRVVFLSQPPTAEVLAVELKLEMHRLIDVLRADRVVPAVTRVDYVTVWETPDFAGRA